MKSDAGHVLVNRLITLCQEVAAGKGGIKSGQLASLSIPFANQHLGAPDFPLL